MMDGATFFQKLLPLWRPIAVAEVGAGFFDRFIERRKEQLISILDRQLAARAEGKASIEAPPDEWTPARRAKANLAAMELLATKDADSITNTDRRVLLGYSGWGGLSIEKYQDQFPKGWDPDSFGLVHEFYTPTVLTTAVAEALCDFLPGIAGRDGIIRALEPAAGIGRFMLALNRLSCGETERPPIVWTAVELSPIAAKMLPLLFPNSDVLGGSFEEWLYRQTNHQDRRSTPKGVEITARDQGKFRLLITNPPYGQRGITAKWDQAPEYAEREAFVYFLRRGLDLLAPYGIGVFVVPAGFLTGMSAARRALRERVLRRHHLMGAFRLPSATFPGAHLVTDLLFFRARGGELAEVDEGDIFIVDGRYFEKFSSHVLGEEKGHPLDENASDSRPSRFSHQVIGTFEGLPPLVERPLCSACIVRPIAFPAATASRLIRRAASGDDLTPLLAAAVTLGNRVTDYLAERAKGNARALELWPELLRSLRDFQSSSEAKSHGVDNPWAWMELRGLADSDNLGAQQFLNAFTKAGSIIAALTAKPEVEERYRGESSDLLGQAEFLYRSRRRITLQELLAFHHELGGSTSNGDALARLFAAEWCLDGEALRELVPLRDYVTGELWRKLDRVELFLKGARSSGDFDDVFALAKLSDPGESLEPAPVEQLQLQVQRLLAALRPLEFEDIGGVSPGDGFIPLRMLSEWASEAINGDLGAIRLIRQDGLLQIEHRDEAESKPNPVHPELLSLIGWMNHDNKIFRPKDLHTGDPEAEQVRLKAGVDKPSVWERRASYERAWTESFAAWLRTDPAREEVLRDAYNRHMRSYVRREYSSEPIEIGRWGGEIRLAPHQNAAARRVIEARGGLLAFDVGVGKTYTGLAILARARQEGWGQRPVVLVPPSLVWKWKRDFTRCLPDYRVAVIGSTRRELSRGKRVEAAAERLARGEISQAQYQQLITVAKADTPHERAAKWSAFQAGLFDAVILSYTALNLTQVDIDTALDYAKDTPAISRITSLQGRDGKKKSEYKQAKEKNSVKGFVMSKLEIDERRELDPGINWGDLGIDLLIVDEAQNFKNLYAPEPREGGIPKYMGLPAGGSKRAWQLDFRASFVRQRTGGSGVVLLSATPAKNSPLEFYNVLQYIDHEAFMRVGIYDPEDFIDRYLKIESRLVIDTNFDIVRKSVVVGFHHLDELRTILDRYAEFRTAEEVGIKLPKPRVQRVDVVMDDAQEEKYDELVSVMTERLEAIVKGTGAGAQKAVLGDMVRMSLIAMHSQLDEGYDWRTALEGGMARRKIPISSTGRWMDRGWDVVDMGDSKKDVTIERNLPKPDYHSPKFAAVAERIAAQPGCGHIIFCEPVASHVWIREVLVERGIPRERIAVMNAASTDTSSRMTIADNFNGDEEAGIEPVYDVLIANSVAYEGVDLQVRTCAIHHLDLPWTPADLEQRNGRAYRQGNTLAVIEILYYMAEGSMDGYRFAVIHGKRTWLTDLLESQERDTNNPAAQQDFSPEDMLEYIARDKSGVKELLAQRRAQLAEEERARQGQNAAALMSQAASRFRSARRLATKHPERATQLRKDAESRLTILGSGSGDAWPWTSIMYAFREVDGIVPGDGSSPVFEGLRVVRSRETDGVIEAFEFGRVLDDSSMGRVIGMRRVGTPHWTLVDESRIKALEIRPQDLLKSDDRGRWPVGEEATTKSALSGVISRMTEWTALRWRGACEAFLDRWWSRLGATIIEQLARRSRDDQRLPLVIKDELRLKAGPALRDGELLPPTAEGWQRYLDLAPRSSESWAALRDAGERWWSRGVPRDLLAEAPVLDDDTALARLERSLREAHEAYGTGPGEFATWLIEHDFEEAADHVTTYLHSPAQGLDAFGTESRRLIDASLSKRFYAKKVVSAEGVPIVQRDSVFDDAGRTFVLVRGPDLIARRVYVEAPQVYGAPYTVIAGYLEAEDRLWDVSESDIDDIEAVWSRYQKLIRSLELIPASLERAYALLKVAAEAIKDPKCSGSRRSKAIRALRVAHKYYRRAADRIHEGRPSDVLTALAAMVDHVATSARAVAEACAIGGKTAMGDPVRVAESDRKTLVSFGEHLIDRQDFEPRPKTKKAAKKPAKAGASGKKTKTAKKAKATKKTQRTTSEGN